MPFDVDNFKKEYGSFIYGKLLDFIDSEINVRTLQTIRLFVENPQLSGMYEGNQYIITKEKDSDLLTIIDVVSEEHGVSLDQTRFKLQITDLLDIMSEILIA